MDLSSFVEDKLNQYAKKILTGGATADEHALGEITFYTSLRRVLEGKATAQDVGMVDAVNDTLQQLGLVQAGSTFYKK
jgi:hypothetical protein